MHILFTVVRAIKPVSAHFGQRCRFDVGKISSDSVREHISVYVC